LDYKNAFYGACVLVSVFAGLSWRLFTGDITDHNAAISISDKDQWVSIHALEKQFDGTARDVASWDKFATILEARIRALEHHGDTP
jgi:hypothetical protein